MSSYGILPSSTLNRVPKVIVDTKVSQNGKVKVIKTTKQAGQLGACDHINVVHNQTVKGVPLNLFRNAGAKFSAVLEGGSVSKLESLALKVNLNITGGAANAEVELTIPTYFFDRHEYRASNGSRHLNIVYNDSLHFALTTLDRTVLSRYCKAMGFDLDANGTIVNGEKVQLDANGAGSAEVFIPILGGWLANGDLYWKNVDGDLVFDFHPAASIVAVGGPCQVDCLDMSFVIQTEIMEASDAAVQDDFYRKTASELTFLDAIPINYFSEQIVSGQKKNFKLDSLNGEFAFLALYIRSTSTTPGNIYKDSIQDIGNRAKIDIVKNSGQSVLGNGTAIPYNYLKNFVLPTQFPNSMLDNLNVVVVPLGGNVTRAFAGYKDGCLHLDISNNLELSIVTDSNFATGTYDVQIYGYRYRTLFNHFGRLAVSE